MLLFMSFVITEAVTTMVIIPRTKIMLIRITTSCIITTTLITTMMRTYKSTAPLV